MRKLICIMLLIVVLVSSMLLIGNVHAITFFQGVISSDTTWRASNSPIALIGPIIVNSGVTLTIEPGVTVDFYSYYIQVNGILNAQGTNDSNIIFLSSNPASTTRIDFTSTSTGWNETTGSGCVIKNAVLSSVRVTVTNCSPKISNNYFTNNLNVLISSTSGSPLILNNAIDCRNTGISVTGGSPMISNNFIKGNGANYGISAGDNAYISDNNITGCYAGINSIGNSMIERNLVTGNNYGVASSTGTARIENNVVASNSYGIYGGGSIKNNTVGNNMVGVTVSILPTNITQNNIFSNTQNNLRMSTSSAVDATYNWWGITDTSPINQTIWDFKNNANLGKVNFTPFLNNSNSAAPALESINYVPIPTPTPFPTPAPVPTPTHPPLPPSNVSLGPISTSTPPPSLPTAPPTATPTPIPTPSPTPKTTPGSPLTLGGSTFTETISQFDIMGLAKLVLIALGIMWVIIILVSVDRKFAQKDGKKQ